MVYTTHQTLPDSQVEAAPTAAAATPESDAPRGLSSDLHTTFAQSRIGRGVITFFVGLMAAGLFLPNLPPGPFSDGVDVLWSPAEKVGLIQRWHVFSPYPRAFSLESKALIEFEDGSRTVWQIPQFDAAVGSYREYRWRKWEESLGFQSSEKLWEPTALWIAEQHSEDGDVPIKITLIERTKRIYTVGFIDEVDGQPARGDWVERVYYTWERDQ